MCLNDLQAFKFSEAGVRLSSLVREPPWVDWLARFFTVVEYPVDGYVPPAILTHMQFELRRCSVDVVPQCHAARLSLCVGAARIACNIQVHQSSLSSYFFSYLILGNCYQDDAAQPHDPSDPNPPPASSGPLDLQFEVRLEDLSLFLGWQSSPSDSVCLADLDLLDLNVQNAKGDCADEDGGESPQQPPFTDVGLSGNLLRVRTCPDGLVLMGELVNSMLEERDRLDPSAAAAAAESDRSSRERSEEPVGAFIFHQPAFSITLLGVYIFSGA